MFGAEKIGCFHIIRVRWRLGGKITKINLETSNKIGGNIREKGRIEERKDGKNRGKHIVRILCMQKVGFNKLSMNYSKSTVNYISSGHLELDKKNKQILTVVVFFARNLTKKSILWQSSSSTFRHLHHYFSSIFIQYFYRFFSVFNHELN